MIIKTHILEKIKIAEVISDDIVFQTSGDGLELLGNLYYQGLDKIIIHERNINSEFFKLKNGLAGEILQKFSNYRIRLAIVVDFKKFPGKSIAEFIYESNKESVANFVSSSPEG